MDSGFTLRAPERQGRGLLKGGGRDGKVAAAGARADARFRPAGPPTRLAAASAGRRRMAPFDIREARVEDAAAACDVLRRSITELCAADHRGNPEWLAGWLANKTPENVATWISDPGNVVYVALDDGRIAGVAAMNKTGRISLNYVSPDARFRGVSKALLAALEAKAAALGLLQCTLESTKTALRFYRAAGYREQTASGAPGPLPADAESCRPMVKNIV